MSAANRRAASILAAASLVAAGAAGCTGDSVLPAPPYQLVFFDSCADALAGLRAATKASMTSIGVAVPGGGIAVPDLAADDRAQPPAPAMGGDVQGAEKAPRVPRIESNSHSGTNVHESGVDEPDLVKTDGRRIVTVSDGRLSVVDVATRRLVGAVDLRGVDGSPGITWNADLMLAGDHALLFSGDQVRMDFGTGRGIPEGEVPPDVVVDEAAAADPVVDPIPIPSVPPGEFPVAGTTMLLVDLTTPRILSRARADGFVVDARQVGSTVRLVLRSSPRLVFPMVSGDEEQRIAAYRATVDAAGIDAWAPRLEVTTGEATVRTQVGCDAISHPAAYSGSNLLTVLSFDASKDALGDGTPVSIVADGDTVYSNGTSLYVASNQAWPMARGIAAARFEPRTEIYRFDITGERPRYAGGGSVPGQLLNQYSMSEWDGRLRVATTSMGADNQTQSGIYVLRAERDRLVGVGSVEGLGKGERIYAVRFVGPVGYVVTFRQTDPLYTVDLSNPSSPVVRGELKIPGYSAYLHPVGETRLIGVGQDATDTGRVLGTQVSLFDVSDLDNPTRVAKYTVSGGYSEAEFDPHAFLYWPADGLLVIPLSVSSPVLRGAPTASSGALVLRVHGDELSEVGFVTHPAYEFQGWGPTIQRSLVTVEDGDTTLWTVSDGGLQANDAKSLARLAWIPL